MRLIDADELLTAFPVDDEPYVTKSSVRMTIQRMPTIGTDAQELAGTDLISRQAAINSMKRISDSLCEQQAVDALYELPAAEVVPMGAYKQTAWERDTAIAQLAELGYSLGEKIRQGHWILQTDKSKKLYGWHICSECGAYIGEPTNYCSECGTKMEVTDGI